MDALIRNEDVALRLMQDDTADYELMAKWLSDPRVLEFYEGRDNPFPFARVIAEYSPRLLCSQSVTPCFLIYDERPIGYMQFCPIASEEGRRDSWLMRATP
jgi:aminoglycoside 6'-N-acetyltransferase